MSIEVSILPDAAESTLKARVDRTAYLANLLNLRADLPADLASFQPGRDRAAAIVQELAIPTTREEDWRFTDLSALLQVSFQPPDQSVALSFSQLEPFILPEAVNSRLVFVDGQYSPDLSAVDDLPDGVLVGNLAAGAAFVPNLQTYWATQQGAEEVFTALNTASLVDAAIVYLPKHQIVTVPIQVLFVSTPGATTLSHPRCLVIAEPGSSLTLVEEYVSLGEGVYFTNPVTEIAIAETAQVHHTRVQRDSVAAFHIGKTAVSQARDSRYTCVAINLGGAISRHNLAVHQTGEQTDTTLNGLTLVAGDQIGDTHSTIAFTKPYGTSNQVNKCIVDDRARAIFNGKIFVPQAAQLTNAAQLSRNLLLSPKARVDTKPQLEITADNVKCAHGATVSQLDDDEVFYLQSRGLNQDDARQLLTFAFAIEIINEIPLDSLKKTLTTIVRTQTP